MKQILQKLLSAIIPAIEYIAFDICKVDLFKSSWINSLIDELKQCYYNL